MTVLAGHQTDSAACPRPDDMAGAAEDGVGWERAQLATVQRWVAGSKVAEQKPVIAAEGDRAQTQSPVVVRRPEDLVVRLHQRDFGLGQQGATVAGEGQAGL